MPISFANNAYLKSKGGKYPELLKKRGSTGINSNILLTNRLIFKFHI